MNRRSFLQYAGLSGLTMGAIPSQLSAFTQGGTPTTVQSDVNPTAAQQKWMDYKFGMFVHFGINTYFDVEWSEGDLDPAKFNPTKLNTDQWVKTARDAGMQYIVIVTKHHDGFCLWPSKYTDYSVKSSPYQGDVIAELVNSSIRHGIKVGFYYSLWDQHEPLYSKNIYRYVNDYMFPQLDELMHNYGEVVELWLDGFWKQQKNGWTKEGDIVKNSEEWKSRAESFIEAWRMEGAYWWQIDRLYQMVKSWQPNCMIMNNATSSYKGVPLFPVDVRSGERYVDVKDDTKIWQWLGEDHYLPLQIETTMSSKGNERFKSGNWFWHEWDHSVRSKEEILQYLDVAERENANLLLNVGPSPEGLLRPEDVKVLRSLKA